MKKQCIVIGLGIYGMNVARKLSEEGMEVFAIDKDMRLVERASNFATKAVCMDITNIDAFDGIPVGDFDVGVVGTTQIGGATPQLRHDRRDGIDHSAGGLAGCDLGSGLEAGFEIVNGLVEFLRQLTVLDAVVESSLVRVGISPLLEGIIPFLVCLKAALCDLAGVGQCFFVHLEGLRRIEAEGLLETRDGLVAQSGAMGRRIVGLARSRPCDERVDLDEVRTIGDLLGLLDDLGQAFDVFLVGTVGLDEAEFIGVPAVGLVTLDHVLVEGDLGLAFDLDVVGVEEDEQVAELLIAGKRGGFAGDAFLDVAFTADDPHLVVERGLALRSIRIEQAALVTLAICETDGGCDTLTQWAGGHFDTGGQAVLRMARSAGIRAATEVLEVIQRQAITGEVQLHILGKRCMTARKNETIATGPVRYLLEGMACPGGCVAGAGTLQVVKKAAAALEKMKGEASFTESSDSKYQSRLESLEKFDVE